jgi:hypothetical protein
MAYSFHVQRHGTTARFARKMRKAGSPPLPATPGIKGDRSMTLAQTLVFVIDDDLSMRKAIGRLLK